MKHISMEKLDCLSPEQIRDAYLEHDYKTFVEKYWPYMLRTERRLLPLLPEWMQDKVISATELYDHCNDHPSGYCIWNHSLTLSLNHYHEVTFDISDSHLAPGSFNKEVQLVIEVYKDLQALYEQYGHPLTIVSCLNNDFGMFIPESFNKHYKEVAITENLFDESHSVEEIVQNIASPYYDTLVHVNRIMHLNREMYDDNMRNRYYAWFARRKTELNKCLDRMSAVLNKSQYIMSPCIDCIDILISTSRQWGRNFYVKWNLDYDIADLKQLDRLRPLIDAIISKTECSFFAYGVKPKGKMLLLQESVTTI